MMIRDRIKEFKRVKAGSLAPSPLNWRLHPEAQVNALRGLLAEVGFAGAVLARELKDGSLQLIDGHLRTETVGPDVEIPVLVLDVSAEEASKILATFDPLGAMAETDAETLGRLMSEVSFDSPDIKAMLEDLGALTPDFGPATADDQGKLDEKAKTTCPNCGHEF